MSLPIINYFFVSFDVEIKKKETVYNLKHFSSFSILIIELLYSTKLSETYFKGVVIFSEYY